MARAGTVEVAVEIRLLDGMPELTRAIDALRAIWSFPDGEAPISSELLRALALAGGYVAGAFADGEMVGASAGFLGVRDGEVHLHSHISGVVPPWQGRHVGLALKQHQREWALARGVNVIEWTFDPLVRRNAFFNLMKLGATLVGFEPDFYGEMHDAINAGDPTDRAVVRWDLAAPAPAARLRDHEGVVILATDGAGAPVTTALPGDGALRAWVPEDIVELRRNDAALGREWRLALRETLGVAVQAGYVAHSITRDGWYRLERP
ncbi:MAG TPA: GNAT family N-acetyltransferase [Acidimicrobiales bacterium]|nr:GNAT family N-acetyltransferase [Acidimicrobiales bacterium]